MKKSIHILLAISCLSLLFAGVTSAQSAAPQIRSIDPDRAGEGQIVIIRGRNFSTNTAEDIVLFGTNRATVIKAKRKKLTVVVPPGLAAGTYQVTVEVAGLKSNAVAFQVVIPVIPFDGRFSGRTSQNNSFSFVVQPNQQVVSEFRASFTCAAGNCTAGVTINSSQIVNITNGRFELELSTATIRIKIEGMFTSPTEARGTVEFESLSGCRCETGRLTWTADLD